MVPVGIRRFFSLPFFFALLSFASHPPIGRPPVRSHADRRLINAIICAATAHKQYSGNRASSATAIASWPLPILCAPSRAPTSSLRSRTSLEPWTPFTPASMRGVAQSLVCGVRVCLGLQGSEGRCARRRCVTLSIFFESLNKCAFPIHSLGVNMFHLALLAALDHIDPPRAGVIAAFPVCAVALVKRTLCSLMRFCGRAAMRFADWRYDLKPALWHTNTLTRLMREKNKVDYYCMV